jgi:hypothetical protein
MMTETLFPLSKARIQIPITGVPALNHFCVAGIYAFEPKIKILTQNAEIAPVQEDKNVLPAQATLIFIRYLSALVMFFAVMGARAQTGVTLAWDAVTNSSIVGYRLYQGTASRTYPTVRDLSNVTQTTLTNLASDGTNYFSVTAYDSNGAESDYSSEVQYVVQQRPPPATLVFAATSGTISGPFVVTNGVVYQTTQTGATNGGSAVYTFTLANAGDYIVVASVNAPNQGADSLYVNIDAEPADPNMIWDIPLTTGFMTRTATWRSIGSAPKIFTLQAGTHELVIRGREANVQFSSVTISPAYPTIQLNIMPGNLVLLTGMAQIGQNYEVQASQDLKTWSALQTIAPDNTGSLALIDPAASSYPSRYYRLRGVGP